MKTFANLRISQKALLKQGLRTILSLLGITVGVSAVIILVAIGNGARQEVVSRIEAMGTNLLIVDAGDVRTVAGRRQIRGKVTTLTPQDADAIARQIPDVETVVPLHSASSTVRYGGFSTSTTVVGTSASFPEARNFRPAGGWFFSAEEDRTSRRLAVLGRGVAENLFERTSPLGAIIRIGKVPFEVIGVMEPKGVDMYGTDQDDQVFVPLNTALRRVFNRDHIETIYVSVTRRDRMDAAVAEITELLHRRHRLQQSDEPDFTIQSQTDLIEAHKETSDTLTTLTAGVAGISLIVGGIGILAVMLLSIRERRSEIGLRMAVGARPRDVRTQFLFESMALGVGGGTSGVVLGVVTALIMRWVVGWEILISPASILVSFGFSLMIGIIFGVYPAHKASLMDPIDALRAA
ncbi:MAG: ABC transporter permease [Gemmatimonadota bacterium]